MEDKIRNIIESLKSAPEIIGDYILSIPEEDLDLRRREGFWSVREHALHIEYVQDVFIKRISTFRDEENPAVKPYFPENDKIDGSGFSLIEEVVNSYKSKRTKQIDILNGFSNSDFLKQGKHDEFKNYNMEILLTHILYHDYWHMYRIEELWLTKDEYLQT